MSRFPGYIAHDEKRIYNNFADREPGFAFCANCSTKGRAGKWCLPCCIDDGMVVERCFICSDDGPVWVACFNCIGGEYRPKYHGVCEDCGNVGPSFRHCIECRDGFYKGLCGKCGIAGGHPSFWCEICGDGTFEQTKREHSKIRRQASIPPIGDPNEVIVIDSSSDDDNHVSPIALTKSTEENLPNVLPIVNMATSSESITKVSLKVDRSDDTMLASKRLKTEHSYDIKLRPKLEYELDQSGHIKYMTARTHLGRFRMEPMVVRTEAERVRCERKEQADYLFYKRGMGPVAWKASQGLSIDDDLNQALGMIIQKDNIEKGYSSIKGDGDPVAAMPVKGQPVKTEPKSEEAPDVVRSPSSAKPKSQNKSLK